MRALLAELEAELAALEKSAAPSWSGVVEPLERIGDRLGDTWGVVGHLLGVRNSPALRTAHEAVQPEVVRFGLRVAPEPAALRRAARAARRAPTSRASTPRSSASSTLLIRDAKLSGVGLEGAARERFNAIQTELAERQTRVLEPRARRDQGVRARAARSGRGRRAAARARSSSRRSPRARRARPTPRADAGPWRITLDQPSLVPVPAAPAPARPARAALPRQRRARERGRARQHAADREDPRAAARGGRACSASPPSRSCASPRRWRPTSARCERLLEELRAVSYAAARARARRSCARFARARRRDRRSSRTGTSRSGPSACARSATRTARRSCARTSRCRACSTGLFALAERLFGVRIRAADGEAPVWQPDVRFFRVDDDAGQPLAAFYLDPYSRPAEKRGGAWMDECVGRSRLFADARGRARLPVAHLVCNQTPPVGDKPVADDVRRGRDALPRVRPRPAAHADPGRLRSRLGHPQRRVGRRRAAQPVHGELVLPPRDPARLRAPLRDRRAAPGRADREAARRAHLPRRLGHAAPALLRAARPGAARRLRSRRRAERRSTSSGASRRARACSRRCPRTASCAASGTSSRGGYAAGYYSYKWAEVLSADAFAAFEEAGLENAAALARDRPPLPRHGARRSAAARPRWRSSRRFRGREPSTDALLRHYGLLAA